MSPESFATLQGHSNIVVHLMNCHVVESPVD